MMSILSTSFSQSMMIDQKYGYDASLPQSHQFLYAVAQWDHIGSS